MWVYEDASRHGIGLYTQSVSSMAVSLRYVQAPTQCNEHRDARGAAGGGQSLRRERNLAALDV